jgi:hypothetical protein
MSWEAVRPDATRPKTAGSARSMAMSARQRTLDDSYRCRSGELSAYLIKAWTSELVKARG